MNEGGRNDDTGAEVLGKVEGFSVDGESWYTSCEDGEEGDEGGRSPNDEDGTNTETGGAGAIVSRPCALYLISHVDMSMCD